MASGPLPSGGIAIIIVTTVFLFLAILAVIARFYSKRLQNRSVSIDDYLIIAGLIFTIATIAVGYLLVLQGGAGLHIKDATEEQIATILLLFVPAPLLWSVASTFVKLSILFFYIDIFTTKRMRRAVYVTIAVTIVFSCAVFLQTFLICRPFKFTWNKTIDGVCGSTPKAYLSVAICNLILDLSIVALPMPVLWSLQMSYKKKLAISGILSLGLCICAITAARIKSVLEIDPLDFTYTIVADTIFGGLEIELGIINACLPLLRPLLRKLTSSSTGLTTYNTNPGRSDGFNSSQTKSSTIASSKNFSRLRENVYPLHDMETSIHGGADLERLCDYERPGDVLVQKDVYVYSTATGPSNQY